MNDNDFLINMKAAALEEVGCTTCNLDEMVHDCADNLATDINNMGMKDQVKFLLENGWTEDVAELMTALQRGREREDELLEAGGELEDILCSGGDL